MDGVQWLLTLGVMGHANETRVFIPWLQLSVGRCSSSSSANGPGMPSGSLASQASPGMSVTGAQLT